MNSTDTNTALNKEPQTKEKPADSGDSFHRLVGWAIFTRIILWLIANPKDWDECCKNAMEAPRGVIVLLELVGYVIATIPLSFHYLT